MGKSKKEEICSPRLPSEEEKEKFTKDFQFVKSLCWLCDRIAKKIHEKKEVTEADGYHMSTCLPAIMSVRMDGQTSDQTLIFAIEENAA
jgi:hypothetical protein